MANTSISRDAFLRTAGLGAAAATFGAPAFLPQIGSAAETLKIGMIEELTGVYAAPAASEELGAKIALAQWNARGGVMGRQVELTVEDDANDPGVAVQKMRKLVEADKVSAVIGTLNSAASLSASAAANSLNTLFIVSGGHADDIAGAKCHWNTYLVPHTTWMLTHATGFSIGKKFGKRWHLITPDYAFGHALQVGYEDVAKKIGATILANDLTPLGTTDFSPYLTKIETEKPDCLIVLVQGADWINLLKQASAFGILKTTPVAGPFAELESIWAVPEEARVGYWGTEWYYNSDLVFGKSNTMAHGFVNDFRKAHGKPPTSRNVFGYTAMNTLLQTIADTKTTDSVKLAHALSGRKITGMWDGPAYFRPVDHGLMWPMWFGSLRGKGTPADPYDVFDVIDRQEPQAIAQSDAHEASVCKLDWPS